MDRPNFFQVDTFLTGISLLTAIPPLAGQQYIQLGVIVGANAFIGNGASAIVGKGIYMGGATLPMITLAGAATLVISSVGASCEIGVLRACVV